jgi:hypothetical protein
MLKSKRPGIQNKLQTELAYYHNGYSSNSWYIHWKKNRLGEETWTFKVSNCCLFRVFPSELLQTDSWTEKCCFGKWRTISHHYSLAIPQRSTTKAVILYNIFPYTYMCLYHQLQCRIFHSNTSVTSAFPTYKITGGGDLEMKKLCKTYYWNSLWNLYLSRIISQWKKMWSCGSNESCGSQYKSVPGGKSISWTIYTASGKQKQG